MVAINTGSLAPLRMIENKMIFLQFTINNIFKIMKIKYDLAVIGGGPAGMMAAARAGELGARVILLEKNVNLGTKLLITGNGRCNFTNNSEENMALAEKFGNNGKFLFSSLSQFGPEETINFFASRGVNTIMEKDNRVFPESGKSRDILETLERYLKESKVAVKNNAEVKEIIKKGKKIVKVILANDKEIIADKFIIATGGKSYPQTGSSGDGYAWLEKLGHTIIELKPSLTPIIVREKFVKELEGLSLKNIEINLFKDNKKIDSSFGEAIFTANGLSGPAVFNLSRKISQELPNEIKIRIDFKPELSFKEVDLEIQKIFTEFSNKMLRNSLDKLLSSRLALTIIKILKIDPDKNNNFVTKEERKALTHFLKEFELEIESVAGFEKAMITIGGIKLSEVNPKTMRSKLIDNLYFTGEILDLDGPTGGYNLQVCWSTGYAAGEHAAEK